MKIAIVAGGTGGHIYPGIAVAQELSSRAEILFIGSEEGMEADFVPRYGFNLRLIKSRALLRKLSYKALSAPFVTILGFFQALFLLRSFQPNLLISFGGYVSLPVVFAALLLQIPIYIHEQNVLPGLTNRICFKFAKKVFLSFEESRKYAEGSVIGNPVRREILEADRSFARKELNISSGKKVILVVGGSQGARKINQTIISSLEKIPSEEYEILHVIGNRDFGWASHCFQGKNFTFYHPFTYLYNIEEALAAADIVISRAGATAIAEFLSRGLPMILIPFPYSSEGHQDLNAKAVEDAGCAVVVSNQEFTAEKFLSVILDRNLDLDKMKENCKKLARPNAAKEIVLNLGFCHARRQAGI